LVRNRPARLCMCWVKLAIANAIAIASYIVQQTSRADEQWVGATNRKAAHNSELVLV